jgi:hypothetical protein
MLNAIHQVEDEVGPVHLLGDVDEVFEINRHGQVSLSGEKRMVIVSKGIEIMDESGCFLSKNRCYQKCGSSRSSESAYRTIRITISYVFYARF